MCLCLQPKTVQKILGREYLVCSAIIPLFCSCVHLLPEFHTFSNKLMLLDSVCAFDYYLWSFLILCEPTQVASLVSRFASSLLDRFFSVFGLLRSLSLNLFHLSSELQFFCLAGETRFVAMGELHFFDHF